MGQALVETFAIHQIMNLSLLAAMTDEQLTLKAAPKGARSVGDSLAHIHNVRLMWLQSAGPDLLEGLTKLEMGAAHSIEGLRAALTASGAAIQALLTRAFEGDQRIKGFKPHASAFVGYLISHESHHRGQVALSLRLAGAPLNKKAAFGLWEWGRAIEG